MLGCSARGWGGQLQLAGIPWLLSQQVPATLTTLCAQPLGRAHQKTPKLRVSLEAGRWAGTAGKTQEALGERGGRPGGQPCIWHEPHWARVPGSH